MVKTPTLNDHLFSLLSNYSSVVSYRQTPEIIFVINDTAGNKNGRGLPAELFWLAGWVWGRSWRTRWASGLRPWLKLKLKLNRRAWVGRTAEWRAASSGWVDGQLAGSSERMNISFFNLAHTEEVVAHSYMRSDNRFHLKIRSKMRSVPSYVPVWLCWSCWWHLNGV